MNTTSCHFPNGQINGHVRETHCASCANRDDAVWAELSPEELRLLASRKVCNTYLPGQHIFYQGNPCMGIYCIESGSVAIRKTDAQGHSVVVRLAHAGQTIGYRAFFSSEPYSASAEALTPTRICFIDRASVRGILERNPIVGMHFLKRIASDLREAEDARLQSTLSVRARLAHLMLVLKERCATVTDDGVLHFELPLSRQDLAAMVGTRPETIARTIRALEDDGVALFRGRHVSVPDLDALLDELEVAVHR